MSTSDCERIRYIEMPGFNKTYDNGPLGRPEGIFVDVVIFWTCFSLYCLGLIFFPIAKHWIVPRTSPYWRYLDIREYPPIAVQHVGAILLLINSSLFAIVPFGVFPCWATYGIVLLPPMVAIPISLRLFAFYRRLKLSEASSSAAKSIVNAKAKQTKKASPTPEEDPPEEEDESSHHHDKINWRMLLKGMLLPVMPKHWVKSAFLRKRHVRTSQQDQEDDLAVVEGVEQASMSTRVRSSLATFSSHEHSLEMIVVLRLLSTKKGTIGLMLLVFAPLIIVQLVLFSTSQMVRHNCTTCMFNELPVLKFSMYTASVLAILLYVYSIWLVRKAEDPLLFVFESKIAAIVFGIPTVLVFIASGFAFREGYFNLRFIYHPLLCITCVIHSIVPAAMVVYWHYRTVKVKAAASRRDINDQQHDGSNKEMLAHQVSNVTAGGGSEFHNNWALVDTSKQNFENVLADARLFKAFEAHMTAEHGVESLLFLVEIRKWMKEYTDLPERTMFIRARKIVSLFVGDNAIFPVNLPYETIINLQTSVGISPHASTSMSRGKMLFSGGSSSSFQVSERKMEQQSPGRTGASGGNAALPLINRDLFTDAEREIIELMRNDGFHRFLSSKRYREIIKANNTGNGEFNAQNKRLLLVTQQQVSSVSSRMLQKMVSRVRKFVDTSEPIEHQHQSTPKDESAAILTNHEAVAVQANDA